jgi:hypothetical protein
LTEDQVIIAAELTQEENDVKQLHPMIEKAKENMEEVGVEKTVGAVVADAWYLSEDNLKKKSEEPELDDGPELYIATMKDRKQRAEPGEPSRAEDAVPENPTECQKMEQKLSTEKGRAIYKKRGQMVEPVFGQIKDTRGCDKFMRRRLEPCDGEWKLLCATHNLLKLWRHRPSAKKNGAGGSTMTGLEGLSTVAA